MNNKTYERSYETMKAVVLVGRIFFSIIFLNTVFAHFSAQGINYAAASGVPLPNILVPISGVIAIAGALSIIFGYKAKAGAWLLILFLIPVTIFMHDFWMFEGAEAQTQMINFMKNLSILGGAFFIAYFGAGPLSIDNRTSNANIQINRRQKLNREFPREGSKSDRAKIQRREKDKS